MKTTTMRPLRPSVLIILLLSCTSFAQQTKPAVDERNVRAELGFLASDAMQRRGSGSQFERVAAEYIGSQFMQFGLEPAGEVGWDGKPGYTQTVSVPGREVLSGLKIAGDAGNGREIGRDFAVLGLSAKEFSGPLQIARSGDVGTRGAVVLLTVDPATSFEALQPILAKLRQDGAAAVFVRETNDARQHWSDLASAKISVSRRNGNLLMLSSATADGLSKLAPGTVLSVTGQFAAAPGTNTWNAIAKLTGSDPALSSEVILLSSHLDHLGVRPNAPGDDKIYNGADDDASGSVAVLEMARVIGKGKPPKRTVYFVCFGSEEAGGFGATYFVNNMPFPKEKLVANLEFEMIGRPDTAVKPDELWLTGYERSNLGPELARRGAKLVQDPHPDQNFFQRSDNIQLARAGVIAHTVSSFGLHKDYHQASDELKTIDFMHMTHAINSMVGPVVWLVNSDFKPAWNEGKKP